MPYYEDPTTKQQTYIGNPSLNPDLVAGKTLIGDTLNSNSLAPQTDLSSQLSYPQQSITYPVSGLNSETQLQLTQPEVQADTLSTRLQKLNEQLLGQSGFKAQQEQAQGIPALQKTQTDLSARLKALQNEALQIPLQLQQESLGRGITTGGLRPIEQGALRTNAIQALSVSSLLEASRGNLTLAQEQVDRAVAQKYDPIKEEIAVKQANLDLILKSPTYTVAEKNRAEAQRQAQETRAKQIALQEQNTKDIMSFAIEAAKKGASTEILAKIQNSQTPSEALNIAGFYLGADFRQEISDKQIQQKLQQAIYQLSIDKFNEDARQFNLTYAQNQQKLALEKLKQDAQISPEGANTLKKTALESATELLRKFDAGEGTSAVGKSGIFFTSLIPGTQAANFKIQFNNLKSLLSLDNIKYLKGQGQVSDAERRLLSEASAKLDLAQSEPEFRKALFDIQTALNGGTTVNLTGGNIFQQVLNTSNIQFFNQDQGYILPK